jgi:hypothetical protein
VVFEDLDNDVEYDTGETVLAKALRSDYKDITGLSSTFTANDVGLPSIAFRPNGIPRSNTGGFAQGTAFVTNIKGNVAQVVISQAGNIRIVLESTG